MPNPFPAMQMLRRPLLALALLLLVAPAASAQVRHTVRKGDTIIRLGAAYGVSPAEIVNLNGLNPYNPVIQTGQILVIPTSSTASTGSAAVPYTIQRNDTLARIAKKFNTTVSAIMRANTSKIPNPNRIVPGVTILVPGAGSSSSASAAPDNAVEGRDFVRARSGDTLADIASYFRISADTLMRYNPEITNPNTVRSGQVVWLVARNQSSATPPDGYQAQYVVKAGDSLDGIRSRFSVSRESIMRANNLRAATDIYPGQIIYIP